MSPRFTDDELERIAIEVEHLPPDEAQAEYERRQALPSEADRRNIERWRKEAREVR